MKPTTNVAASVRQKLLNKARSSGRPFNELLQYYAMERFLYRLSLSNHAERFILKGALMLRAWRSPEARPTMDIDMLGRTSNTEADIIAQIKDILGVAVPDDGLAFEPDSILAETITEDADYEGIRIRFKGSLGVARISMQIDIGFGDIVHPDPEMAEFVEEDDDRQDDNERNHVDPGRVQRIQHVASGSALLHRRSAARRGRNSY